MDNTEISNCSEFGIRFESSRASARVNDDDLKLLTNIGAEDLKLTYSNVEMKNNMCNVLIEEYLDAFYLDSLATDDINMTSDEDDKDKCESPADSFSH